jgi:hypothetical protein
MCNSTGTNARKNTAAKANNAAQSPPPPPPHPTPPTKTRTHKYTRRVCHRGLSACMQGRSSASRYESRPLKHRCSRGFRTQTPTWGEWRLSQQRVLQATHNVGELRAGQRPHHLPQRSVLGDRARQQRQEGRGAAHHGLERSRAGQAEQLVPWCGHRAGEKQEGCPRAHSRGKGGNGKARAETGIQSRRNVCTTHKGEANNTRRFSNRGGSRRERNGGRATGTSALMGGAPWAYLGPERVMRRKAAAEEAKHPTPHATCERTGAVQCSCTRHTHTLAVWVEDRERESATLTR